MIKLCLNCNLPIVFSHQVSPTGPKSWPVAECTDMVEAIFNEGTSFHFMQHAYDMKLMLAPVSECA